MATMNGGRPSAMPSRPEVELVQDSSVSTESLTVRRSGLAITFPHPLSADLYADQCEVAPC
jgi:hypothetical protein